MASHRRIGIVVPAIVALLAIAPAGGRAVELAQNAPITAAPKLVLPPAATLPDLQAFALDIKLTCVGKSVTATFTVRFRNMTKVDADLSRLPSRGLVTARVEPGKFGQVFDGSLDQVVTSPGTTPTVLKGMTSTDIKVTLTNIPRYKVYIPIILFSVTADPDNLVTEAKEDNNSYTKQVNTPCPPSK
jgi:hypothetical protein